MKVKDIIKELKEYEDFELQFNFTDGYNTFPNMRIFENIQVEDICNSEKIIVLSGKETE